AIRREAYDNEIYFNYHSPSTDLLEKSLNLIQTLSEKEDENGAFYYQPIFIQHLKSILRLTNKEELREKHPNEALIKYTIEMIEELLNGNEPHKILFNYGKKILS